VATTISGVDSLAVLRQNLAIARGFKPMTADEMEALQNRCASAAGDGHLELYKSTMKYDGEVGRVQHGLPSPKELALAAEDSSHTVGPFNHQSRHHRELSMPEVPRRDFVAAAAAAATATPASPKPAEAGDPSFQNNVPDPILAGDELPTFKFELRKSEGKVIG